jgi:hypothetical protein
MLPLSGKAVRILSGPFADFIGTLEQLDEAGRVQVLLELMGSHRSGLLASLGARAGGLNAVPT